MEAILSPSKGTSIGSQASLFAAQALPNSGFSSGHYIEIKAVGVLKRTVGY